MEDAMTMSLRFLAPALVLWCGMTGYVAADRDAVTHLDVYKSPTCGCCIKWMNHLAENGITSTGHHPDDFGDLKF